LINKHKLVGGNPGEIHDSAHVQGDYPWRTYLTDEDLARIPVNEIKMT
jgi:hypothetical protein